MENMQTLRTVLPTPHPTPATFLTPPVRASPATVSVPSYAVHSVGGRTHTTPMSSSYIAFSIPCRQHNMHLGDHAGKENMESNAMPAGPNGIGSEASDTPESTESSPSTTRGSTPFEVIREHGTQTSAPPPPPPSREHEHEPRTTMFERNPFPTLCPRHEAFARAHAATAQGPSWSNSTYAWDGISGTRIPPMGTNWAPFPYSIPIPAYPPFPRFIFQAEQGSHFSSFENYPTAQGQSQYPPSSWY